MDLRKIKKLIELIEESGVTEIEIREGDASVRISRGGAPHTAPLVSPAAPLPVAAPAATPAAVVPAAPDGHVITSPMVGTYYASAAPGAPPFVKVGQTVRQGDPLCIIEAMKIMNPIEADRAGTIVSIMAENGQPVEFEQPLFVIA
ncbi:MAG: acetyl-CoA carboxylase biotin carboxyl carrier protein [Gammaproteobacteria bacterium]